MGRGKNRKVFLDADGLINRKPPEGDYIKSSGGFEFLPKVKTAIKKLNEESLLEIIACSQRGIARGFMTEDDLKEIHLGMEEELRKTGAVIDGIYYCPHGISDNGDRRKPKAGLLLKTAGENDINLNRSFIVGDHELDIEVGKRRGCGTILINVCFNQNKVFHKNVPDFIAKDLAEAVDRIKDNTQVA